MSERKYFFLGQKKIIFIGVIHRVRERNCFPIYFLFFLFFFWKTTYRK